MLLGTYELEGGEDMLPGIVGGWECKVCAIFRIVEKNSSFLDGRVGLYNSYSIF
jgi:hypothetical protein